MNKKAAKLFSAVILAYMLIICAGLIFTNVLDVREMADVWLAILEYIPFGKTFGEISVKLFNESFGLGSNMADYVLGLNSMKPADFLFDLCKLMVTGALIDAVGFALQSIIGVWGKKGVYSTFMKAICGIVSAFICTGLAIIVLGIFGNQLVNLPGPAQIAVAALTTLVPLLASVGLLYFAIGSGIVAALAIGLTKTLIVNILKVSATYVFTLLLVMFINEGEYLKILPALGAWAVVIVLMIGVEEILQSVIEK